MQTDQVPTFYRFKLGSAETTIVSDGVLPLGDPHTSFLGPTAEELDAMLTRNFLPTKSAPLEQNTLVLNIGDASSSSTTAWAHPSCSATPPASCWSR